MKKTIATVACAVALITTLSLVPSTVNLGFLGVDVVSAATGDATPTTTITTTTGSITRLLQIGSIGNDVKTLQTNLNKLGSKLAVDGIFGKLTLAEVKNFQKANGLVVDGIVGPKTLAKLNAKLTPPATTTPTTPTTPKPPTTPVVEQTSIKIGRAEFAAHGTKCFSVAVVAMAGDKIVGASVDDYQFAATTGFVGVPNSDKDFGKNYPAGQVLISKRTNAAAYSANMAKSGGATQTWDANMAGIEKFVVGKTIAELDTIIKNNPTDPKVDAVASATFTDTNGYLNAILAAAKDAKENTSVKVDSTKLSDIKMGRAEYAAHGTKCFTVAVAVMAGDKIVADSVDDYQFATATGFVGVPNSDKDFGKNYPAGQILISKRTNAAAYSANMAKSGGATLTWDANMSAVENFATGKTADELATIIKNNPTDPKVDAVASATFTDTNGYLNAIDAAAKNVIK